MALSPDGVVKYEAPMDWAGTDVVDVRVMDREGEAAIAAIRVQVEPRQEAESRGCAHARHRLPSALLLLAALGLATRSRRWERGDPPPPSPQR